MENLITLLYGISGIMAAALYLPQIRAYHRDPAARRSISLLSWGGWLGLACVTVLYALFVIRNPLVAGLAVLNIVAQGIVLFYGVRARLNRALPCAATPAV